MRRENRRRVDDNTKTVFYAVGSLIVIGVLAFTAFYIFFSGGSSKEESQFSTAKIDGLVPNNSVSNVETKTTSSKIGKSVNEAQSSNNVTTNETTTKRAINTTTAIREAPNNTTTATTTKNNTDTDKDKTKDASTKNVQNEKETSTEEVKTEVKDPVFIKPVDGEIIKEYAKDKLVYSDTLKEWITHPGVDIKAEKTSVVKCSADGRVSSIKNDPRYGLTVIVEHQNGFKTVYSNLLTAEFVTEGEEITSGQTIGTVGNTATFEILDADHLHFEILKDNENVDPNIYIQ